MFLYFLENAFYRRIITEGSPVKRRISTDCTKTKAHGGIGIRIEVTVGIHTTHSGIEQAFILLYLFGSL